MALQLPPPRLAAVRPCFLLPSPVAPTRGASATARHASAFSLQSNVRLVKPNRRARRSRNPYYDFDEEEEGEDDEEGYETDVSNQPHCQ